MPEKIKCAVIGAGSFGSKRAAAAAQSSFAELIAVADIDLAAAQKTAAALGVTGCGVDELWSHKPEAVIIAVPNKFHADLACTAVKNRAHVLVEKPLARNVREAEQMVEAARQYDRKIKTGSNHRYFESVKKARQLVDSGVIGELVSFNGRIGNNGERIQDSWFINKDLSGGGTLLDNGCHLLDIARWFLGDFSQASGLATNAYWRDAEVEDSATGVFVTDDGKIATINSSWRQLSGYFYFEINGSHGYITVDGRFDTHGGDNIFWQSSQGRREINSMNFGHVPPNSYVAELDDFFLALLENREVSPSVQDGLAVVKMVEAIYQSKSQTIYLK